MDAVTAFKTGLVELNVNQTQLARYVGVEPSRVSRGLTMELPFTVAETREISETIDAMRSIQAEMSLPIDWSLIGKVKPHVDARRKQSREESDPVVRRCTLIRVGVGFFQRVNGVNVITTPSELNAAAFESPGVAEEVVQQLKKLGTAGRLEFFGAFRRRSTMSSLAEVGLPAKEVTDAE